MNSNGILHLTASPKGVLTLWNTPQEAAAGKAREDVQLTLALTKQQMVTVLRAEAMAREKVQETASSAGRS